MFDKLKNSKVMTRSLSAALVLPLVIGALWFGGYVILTLLCLAGLRAMYELFRMAKKSPSGILIFCLGLAYIGFGFLLCYHLRESYGFGLTLLFFCAMWASDIGAYFSGKFIGGDKMSPVISPNKTWAGYSGALLAPACALMIYTMDVSIEIALFGLCMGIAGQAGDLLVSWLKRDVDVKNTGSLIPGHGGVLDRIDSLIPSIIIFLAALKYGAF